MGQAAGPEPQMQVPPLLLEALQANRAFVPHEARIRDSVVTTVSFAGVPSVLIGISYPMKCMLLAEGGVRLPSGTLSRVSQPRILGKVSREDDGVRAGGNPEVSRWRWSDSSHWI